VNVQPDKAVIVAKCADRDPRNGLFLEIPKNHEGTTMKNKLILPLRRTFSRVRS